MYKRRNEEVKRMEHKVRITNLQTYEKEMGEKYFLKRGYPAAAIAFPIGAFIGYKLGNPNTVIDFIMDSIGLGAGFSGIPIGVSLLIYQDKIDTLKKLKYFLVHKEEITKGSDKEISILNAGNLTKEQLEDYASRGRSKVLG